MNKKCSSLLGLSFWKEVPWRRKVASKIELIEVQSVEEPVRSKDITESTVSESHSEPTPRRSGSVPHQSDIYYDFLVRDGDPIELDENNEDPIIYMDAFQRFDSKAWLGAMQSKMKSMEINNVWTLVDLPKGIKPIELAAYFDYEIW